MAKGDKEKRALFVELLSGFFVYDREVEEEIKLTISVNETLRPFSIKGIKSEVNKAPVIDLITKKILEELPHNGLVKLMHLSISVLRISHWPKSLKLLK